MKLQIQIVAKTASMRRNEWVENADRLVAGFLEMFEERCHKMVYSFPPHGLTYLVICHVTQMHNPFVCWLYIIGCCCKGTAIKDRIQERLRGQHLIGFIYDKEDDDDYYYDDDSVESEDEDLWRWKGNICRTFKIGTIASQQSLVNILSAVCTS